MTRPRFERLKNPSAFRRIAIADWKAPNDPTVYFAFPIEFSRGKTCLEQLSAELNTKITPSHLVAKAAALTLRNYPELNGIIKWRRIYLRKTVDIFLQVAIAEERQGEQPDLSGTKIESCDTKSLDQIALELKRKSQSIRQHSDPQFKVTLRLLKYLPPLLLSGILRLITFISFNLGLSFPKLGIPEDPFGSAMVTNVGSLGVASGFAPLSPMSRVPLVICVGSVEERPWVVDGEIIARPILDLSVSFDHRFIDGLSGARMAQYFKKLIEDPAPWATSI